MPEHSMGFKEPQNNAVEREPRICMATWRASIRRLFVAGFTKLKMYCWMLVTLI